MKYSVVLIVLLGLAMIACVAEPGSDSLVPEEDVPTISQTKAEKIAAGQSEGEMIGSRLVKAVPEGKPSRGFAELAWEVQFQQPGEGFLDMVYVSAVTGEVIRKSVVHGSKYAWTTDGDSLIPQDEAVAAIEEEHGVKASTVKLVHAKADETSYKSGGTILAYEIRLERNSGWYDFVYVDVENGEVIRTRTVPASRVAE